MDYSVERLDKDTNRAFYDSERADDRRRFEEEPSKVFQAESLVPWIVSHLSPGAIVLDIAGGSGDYASRIVRAAPVSVVGLDISESMVRQRSDDPLLPLNVVGDMEALPFASETFDAVMFVACLHHVPDPLPALLEARRVLRPGGLLFAAEPVSLRSSRNHAEQVPGHAHEFRISRRFLLDRVRSAGFEIHEVNGKRLTIRILSLVIRSPKLGLFRASDLVDRLLDKVGLARFGEIALVRGSRPGNATKAKPSQGVPDPVAILACPRCQSRLTVEAERVSCHDCGSLYEIKDGVQILLAEPAALD
jgi:SAM-dependent methyltransferase